tara:strand:- start:57 stop:296 length:240 start_codon:yes stop_codon:yes gene_type:complete
MQLPTIVPTYLDPKDKPIKLIAGQELKISDVLVELKRFQDAYYDAIFEERAQHHIKYFKSQMDHLQQLADEGQEYIANF